MSPVPTAPGAVPALGSGWITYCYWNNGTGTPLSTFKTTWQVPPPPSVQDSGEVVFLFNGIQNYGTNFGILQPVLQWGVSAAGGGPYWSVASWYVTSGGQAFHTNLVRVNPDDTLIGVMTLTGQSGSSFSYTSQFQGINGTLLPVQNIAELQWCNETLEAYGINACGNYPDTPMTEFTEIYLRTGAKVPAVSWTPVNRITDCGQHAVVDSNSASYGEVDLFYRSQPGDQGLCSVRQNLDGRLEAFGVGTDNGLWHIWQTAPNGVWSGWAPLGGIITSEPLCTRDADGRLEVFARGTDNALWHIWQTAPNNGWSGWASLGGVITSNVSAASRTPTGGWRLSSAAPTTRSGTSGRPHRAAAGQAGPPSAASSPATRSAPATPTGGWRYSPAAPTTPCGTSGRPHRTTAGRAGPPWAA